MLYTYKASLVRVIDGDTIVCNIDLGFNIIIKDIKVRLLNYNAPECTGAEKEFGIIAKAKLKTILPETFTIRTTKSDSFGRYLATIWIDNNVELNKKLISDGFGISWDGKGDRPSFDLNKPYPFNKL